MPFTSINGCSIYYEVYGSGVPIVITGGAREPLDMARPLARRLAEKYRVILWDRTTVGRSEIQLAGPRDLELWATQLFELLHRLDSAPAYLVGPSNGARSSMVTALRYPKLVKGMFLFLVTGGGERPTWNLSRLFVETADAARSGGMEAVMAMDHWAELIGLNPANRHILASMRASEMEETMRRWAAAFDPRFPISGLSGDDLGRIETHIRILDATEPTDDFKRANVELAALLSQAELVRDDEFQNEWDALYRKLGKYQGHYTEPASLARLIDRFVSDCEPDDGLPKAGADRLAGGRCLAGSPCTHESEGSLFSGR